MVVKSFFKILQNKNVRQHNFDKSEAYGRGGQGMSPNWWKCLADQLLLYGESCFG